jgi:AraC-like DNA-binding protein
VIFKFHIPGYPLNQFIESFYYFRDFNPVHSLDRFLPDGNVNVVIDLTDYPKFIYDNETLKEIQACRNVWFSGIRNNYITIPAGRDSEMFIINFHKGKAYPFVQMPLQELTDSVVDGDLVLTSEIMNMREMLLSLPAVEQKLIYAEQYLLKQFERKLRPNPFIDYAVNTILQSPRQLTMEKLSGKVGYSQKHFIRLFRENVGVTPKAFLKICRFQKAIQEIEAKKQINWSHIAHEAGYYDQAHFINDFKSFSGFTPRQYLLSKNDQLNYVPVG